MREKIACLGGNPLFEKIMDALHVETDVTSAATVSENGEVVPQVNGSTVRVKPRLDSEPHHEV